MGYWDVVVIVEGALDSEFVFKRDLLKDYFIGRVEEEAKRDELWTQVYVQYHGHPVREEDCGCAQFSTDGRPDFEWNRGEAYGSSSTHIPGA